MKDPAHAKYRITPFINELGLSKNTKERTEAILDDAERTGITFKKGPESVMAAALYIACILEGERRTQEQIGQIIGVSTSTIHTRYRQLVQALKIRSY